MSYYVQMLDGPAKDWAYHTALTPPQTMFVAPLPGKPGEWFREPQDSDAWPDECLYHRGPLPLLGEPVPEDWLTSEGDILVNYRYIDVLVDYRYINEGEL